MDRKDVEVPLESAHEEMTLALEGALEGLLGAYEEVERAQREAEGVSALLRDYFSKTLGRRKARVFSRTVLPDGLRLREVNEYAKNTVCVDSWLLERGKLRDCAAGLVRRLELDAEAVLATVRGLEEEALQELRRRAALRRLEAL